MKKYTFLFSDEVCKEIIQYLVEELEDDITNAAAGDIFTLLQTFPADLENAKILDVEVAGDIIERFTKYKEHRDKGGPKIRLLRTGFNWREKKQ